MDEGGEQPISAAKKKDCGCKGDGKTALSYAEKLSVCFGCKHNLRNAHCLKADRRLFDIFHAIEKDGQKGACPLNRHPDANGNVRLYGLTFNGVPLPYRQLADIEAKRRGKISLASKFPGCGCIAKLKARTVALKDKGRISQFFAARIEALALYLSPKVARFLDWRREHWIANHPPEEVTITLASTSMPIPTSAPTKPEPTPGLPVQYLNGCKRTALSHEQLKELKALMEAEARKGARGKNVVALANEYIRSALSPSRE